MTKLFLTSAGIVNKEIKDVFIAELAKQVQDLNILIVAYAQNEQEEFYVNASKRELEQFGFTKIVVANMHHEVKVDSLGGFDVIYVCGGNTFAILNKLRETKLDNFIKKQVNNGAVYVGVSAGSIIAGPNIEIAGWGSEGDKNEIGLKDLTGFNLVDISIFPHFHEELRGEVNEFKKKVDYKVIELTNDQAIFVNGDNFSLIGSEQKDLYESIT